MIKAVLLDWGNTLMIDYGLPGAMCGWETVSAVDGAAETVSALEDNYIVAIATNGDVSGGPEVRKALLRAGIDIPLHRIFAQKDLGMGKPEPAYFRHIAATLDVSIHEMCMVGDKIESDVKGALNAGLAAVLFDPSGRHRDEDVPRVRVLSSLLKIIRTL